MKLSSSLAAALLALAQAAQAVTLDVDSTNSIKQASAALAYNLMSYYKNNQSSTAATAVGTLPAPLYWWEAGAVWGGMIDYWAYTNDPSYNPTVMQALQAQVGPDNNYMAPAYFSSLGNDDQAFWGVAVMTAAEYGFPDPPAGQPHWLPLAEAVFNTMVPRWGIGDPSCNGGLKWQIFSTNAGYDYKNAISNGGFFQIAARLARYTGNQTYYDWAEKIWDWTSGVGLIDEHYNIYDGTDDTKNCSSLDHTQWSYNPGMWIYGTAMLYNYTSGTNQQWQDRTTGILNATANVFFSPYQNSTNVMFEAECEEVGTCDNDQYSFKAYLSRWLTKTAVVAPYTAASIDILLTASASAAARACGGGQDGATCGERWYTGGYDGVFGIGQQLSALEAVQALLQLRGDDLPATVRYPLHADAVHIAVEAPTSTLSPSPSPAAKGDAKPAHANTGRRESPGGLIGVIAFAALVALNAALVFGGASLR